MISDLPVTVGIPSGTLDDSDLPLGQDEECITPAPNSVVRPAPPPEASPPSALTAPLPADSVSPQSVLSGIVGPLIYLQW